MLDGPHVLNDIDGEAPLGAQFAEELDVARSPAAEAEVRAHEHGLHAERADEHVLHEIPGRQARELLVEVQHQRRIDPGLGEQLQLLMHPDEQRRADLGPEHAERIPVERHGDHARAGRRGIHLRLLDERAVSGVHAVELADRDDGGAEALGHLGRVAEDDHGSTGRWVASHQMPKKGSTSGTNRYPIPNHDHTV